MRLIDADALQKEFEWMASNEWNKETGTSWARAFEEAADMVENAPTVEPIKVGDVCKECWRDGGNVVEVVRCKDCKYTDAHGTDVNGNVDAHCEYFNLWMRGDFYCADGERRSE